MSNVEKKLGIWREKQRKMDLSGCLLAIIIVFLCVAGFVLYTLVRS